MAEYEDKLINELLAEAEEEERAGDRMKGCSWAGSAPPWLGYYRRASLLRTAALTIQINKTKRTKPTGDTPNV